MYSLGRGTSSTNIQTLMNHPVTMRGSPTMTYSGSYAYANGNATSGASLSTATRFNASTNWTTTGTTASNAYIIEASNTLSASVIASAEL
jgi:hypothetical protein